MAAAQGDIETTPGQTCFSLSATIRDHSINGVVTQMGAIGSVKTQRGSSVVTIVGSRKGITALTFEKIIGALRMKRIRIRAFSMPGVLTDANQGASSLSCQVVVSDEQGKDAVRAIHRALYGQPKKRRRV
jgi:aspartokinase